MDHRGGDALPRAKRELYDAGIRVPLIIRWPSARQPAGLEPGSRDERLVSFADLAPIILDMAGVPSPRYLQGRNVLAPETPPRDYIHAARDRIDEQYDRVRAARDKRYKYLRRFDPGTPGAVRLGYRDQGLIMKGLRRHRADGALDAVQSLWFEPRPVEALYDLTRDPDEAVNLAADPDSLPVLTRMRSPYGAWRIQVPDLGDVPEAALADRFWPSGRQPVTPRPRFVFDSEGLLTVTGTAGASIGIRRDHGDWRPYTMPLALPEGGSVSARALRYGYADSEVVDFPGGSGGATPGDTDG